MDISEQMLAVFRHDFRVNCVQLDFSSTLTQKTQSIRMNLRNMFNEQ